MNISKYLCNKAKKLKKTIVFPEADFSERTLKAVEIIVQKEMAKCILIGNEISLMKKNKRICRLCQILDPNSSKLTERVADYIYDKRKEKGLTYHQAMEMAKDPFYFATAIVGLGIADGMVGGAEVSTAQNLKPALQLIKAKQGFAGSYFMFYGKNKATSDMFFITDAGLNEKPTSKQLALLAEYMIVETRMFDNFDPKFAFLSYSTNKSAESDDVLKVRQAYELFAKSNSRTDAIGETQLDAALFERVRKVKFPNSNFSGSANVFIMPDINAGNICYKAIQYFGNLRAIGPVTMGLNKPINDLSRGCSVQDIVDLTAITCMQAET